VSYRYLYLARHGEAGGEGDEGLTEAGRRQAELLGARLTGVPFASVTHSPLPRAAQTAAPWPQAQPSVVVGDYPPYLPEQVPATFAPLLDGWSPEELRDGPKYAQEALARFAVPAERETHELVITHSFLIAWFVRDALSAPQERWMGLNTANTGLTVIRYSDDRPPALMLHNDMSHLPPELQWTGFPPHLRLGCRDE
jgi:serine/threonine-protein phosphatase PGAM5